MLIYKVNKYFFHHRGLKIYRKVAKYAKKRKEGFRGPYKYTLISFLCELSALSDFAVIP